MLWIDGKEVKITDFEKSVLTENLGQTEIDKGRSLPIPAAPLMMGRRFLMFFDFSYNSVRGIKLSREAGLKFLREKVTAGDEVGVVSYSATRGLRIHEFFSLEHDRIRECIEHFGLADVVDRAEDVEGRYLEYLRSQEEAGTEVRGNEAISIDDVRLDRDASRAEARKFVARTKELFQALRYVPGKKYVLFFSSGIPTSLVYGLQGFVGPALNALLRNEYEALLQELAAADVIVFPFDAHDYGVQEASISGAYSLERMAKQTGGRYFGNIKAPGNLDYIHRQTRAYYVLGYPVREEGNGKFHKIQVEVRRAGCRIHAPAGYFSPKPFKDLTAFEKALHLIDLALSPKPLYQEPLPMNLGAYKVPLSEKDSLLFLAELPIAAFRERNIENVEIIDLILTVSGNVVLLKGGRTKIETSGDRPVYYWSVRDVPAGEYECRTVIRDLEKGYAAVGKARVRIGDEKTLRRFYSPLFFTPDKETGYLSTKRGQEKDVLGQMRFFLPEDSKWRPILGAVPNDIPRLLAAYPYRWDTAASPKFRIFFTVGAETDKDFERLFIDYEHHQTRGNGVLIFEVPLGLVREKKMLTLHIEEVNSGSEFSFRIEVKGFQDLKH
jgi:VWFA-related protein